MFIFSLSPLSQAFTPKISGAFVSSSEGGAEKNPRDVWFHESHSVIICKSYVPLK
jgi:hypothetical protein